MTRWRSTFRIRVTLLYAGAVFLAGTVLIVLMALYFGRSLDRHVAARADTTQRLAADFLAAPGTHDTRQVDQLHEALRAQFQQDRYDTLHSMITWSVASLGAVVLLAGGLGWLLAGRVLRPLQRITATAQRVADRSLHERIALSGPEDEIKHLADTFDAMLERLDRSFDGQRRFVANASHELRTPLTINRTLIQVALDTPDAPEPTRQLGTTLLEVNQRHERLIDGLLVLATSDQPLTEHQPVDLADLAQQAATRTETRIDIRTHLTSAPVAGDPVLLERLVQNLLDNAVRYNIPDHGWISVTTGTSDGHAYLSMENPGPTIPAEEVPALFEPFRRLGSTDRLSDPTAPDRGAGLGLSIVRSVAHAHHGDVHARPRPDGGLTVHIRIPTVHSG